ncbi:Tof1p SKDI_14G0600 [Saccharomyces kudriavzevii IFO 1802]|uniref:Topoisomerase 1-associated factor 1 n=1 Tax=Saccharomyces kudriavzevii (strain ATCC MYA-4449 / AS 2.2408 / CBS 8840 / NBRC 1802 / NCYC 2889) TaxID=226230 RepID=A0AA35NK28_SACK1|nr:uncharacterized protein SKDI_14G0600 [Saccharomyces kudriavzevii IFO 1802]CAI4049374.1 hypothetical protein SKDI_14G0600 [Saccharomyces kudriavzevii IFO 1802]
MSSTLQQGATNAADFSLTVLRARIALLATAIGGPDYTSQVDPPPYKLGDDCLACLKDLKRWFKLVDDQQRRWDVAISVAEYRILTDDLLPILIEWENKCSLAAKLAKNNPDHEEFRNKTYYDKIALNCLQLSVLMTWPLIITEQSSSNQIVLYSELKKHQLIYKKAILSTENGKVLRAAVRLALDVVKVDRLSRTPRDNMVLKLVLNFFRNVIAIEPGEFTINTTRSMPSKGITSIDTLPPNVSMDDISLNTVISSFHKNKVFGLLLTLVSSLAREFDQDFINIPLLEIMFYLTKDVNQVLLFTQQPEHRTRSDLVNANGRTSTNNVVTSAGFELSKLLQKEHQMKKNVIKHTSARHSRFGGLLSIQTTDKTRLTISGSKALVDEKIALQKLDDSKKWNKRITQKRDSVATEGLPNSLLNSQTGKAIFFTESTCEHFKKFINNFIDSGFNILLHSVTSYFTTEQDRMVTLEQVEYLLFYAWFIKYHLLRSKMDNSSELNQVSEALKEVSFILVSSLLRSAYDLKNWMVTHAGMIAFNELLNLVTQTKAAEEEDSDDIEFIVSRLFSDERIQLLSNLPKIGSKHSLQFMKSCIELTHSVLKVLEQYSDDKTLVVEGKSRRRKKLDMSENNIARLMKEENIDRDEALDILASASRGVEVNFQKVQSSYMTEPVIETYTNFLQRFHELEDDSIKKVFSFFHRVFVQAKEQSLLFRFDLIILLREMLSPDGLNRMSRSRKYVSQFSDYFLSRLKKRLKKSPAWFVGLLFPPLHSSEVGFYQRYGEYNIFNTESNLASSISQFKPIPDEEALPSSILLDMKYGILVSTLLDDGKIELLDHLLKHITHTLDVFRSWLTVNVNANRETINPPNEYLTLTSTLNNDALFRDKDYRALLSLIGYSIPNKIDEPCFLAGTIEIPDLTVSYELIKKYLSIPFETPNGLPSSSYLLRVCPRKKNDALGGQDGWQENNHYDYNDPYIVPDDQNVSEGDAAYFKDLDNNVSDNLKGIKLSRGIARSKKKDKKEKKRAPRKNLPSFDNEDDERPRSVRERHSVFSKEFISDSEDDEDLMNPIFFENETYMRWLLDKNNGQLTEDRYAQFAKFAAERMTNGGAVTGDYTGLFGGLIPSIDNIRSTESDSFAPDKSLISLSSHVASEMSANDVNNSAEDVNNNTQLSDNGVNSESEENLGSPQLSDSSNGFQSEDNTKAFKKRTLEETEFNEGDEDEEAIPLPGKRLRALLGEGDIDDE